MQGTQRICANKDFPSSMLIKTFSCDIDFQRFLLKSSNLEDAEEKHIKYIIE